MEKKLELLIDLHKKIDEYANIKDLLHSPEQLMKWNEANLSEEEFLALKAANLPNTSICGIEKIIKMRMTSLLFDFLCVIDGVGDPTSRATDDVWLGFRLEEKTLDDEDVNEDFLHDMLFEAFNEWQEMKKK